MRFSLLSVFLLCIATAVPAQDYLVVAPEEFEPALEMWRAHRASQGHDIAVVRPEPDLAALVKRTHGKSGGKLRFVLLLGDVKQIPCAYSPGEVIKIWERDPRIANDHYLSDLDGDELPDLAVGRVPADNVNEARLMLGKVVAYEQSADFGAWRRRVNVIAGVGGFGALEDWALEQVATKFLRENIPAGFDLHVTYANPRSPFCPPPSRVAETTLERFNEGALIVTYMGHGSRFRLDRVRFGSHTFDIFDEDSVYRLESKHGAPIVFFCACSTGHMDGAPDSLAELALKRPAGPVAIFAASRVSMPYANGVFAKELLDAVFGARQPTAGEALVQAKRRMMKPAEGDQGRAFIETLARAYKWRDEERAAECAEHLYLYNLFGDPALRIPHPRPVEVTCAGKVVRGRRLAVSGRSPVAGEALVELVADRSPIVPPRRGNDDEAFATAYARANAWLKASARAPVAEGRFEAELDVPADLNPGAYFVRVYVHGEKGAALGSQPVEVVTDRP